MKNLMIEITESTPEVQFDGFSGILKMRGESFPEDTSAFYAPIFEWLRSYLAEDNGQPITVNMEIVYFNSSSSKALMNFFDLLDDAVSNGRKIVVNWIYEVGNEASQEYGEEFKEDINSLEFNLIEKNV